MVAEPVVADMVVKTDFKLRPRTIEEVGPVDVLLDQQRDAVGYRTYINISTLYMLLSFYQYVANRSKAKKI